jgi:hypothetical protein
MTAGRVPGAFRDPAGQVFVADRTLYRSINPSGRAGYERLMQSGLYSALVADRLLIPHDDLGAQPTRPEAWTIIRPEVVPMVSYPYEWCFSQLRDAAATLLRIQSRALEFGLSLKDASAYNVQFVGGHPVLIDTLSFEPARPGPWVAYRQFCQHFYAPLLLASAADPDLGRLSQLFIDGVPLSLASRLLPRRTYLKAGPLMHIHLHAAASGRLASKSRPDGSLKKRRDGRATPLVIESLERAIAALKPTARSDWASYYTDQPSYETAAFARKVQTVTEWIDRLRPRLVWDLGANTGQFSKIAAQYSSNVIAFDRDPVCVDLLYREVKRERIETILPLFTDFTSPGPAIGWANEERMTLEQRGPADLLLALALVHHLAIGNNVPLEDFANYLARLGRHAIVEFVPKSDPMVQQMLADRDDIFDAYDAKSFERACLSAFRIVERVTLPPSERTLYFLSRNA